MAEAPWAAPIPALVFRTALRAWWTLPEYASQEVYRQSLREVLDAEAQLRPEDGERIVLEEVGFWWLRNGVCPLCERPIEDLNSHLGRDVVKSGARPGRRRVETVTAGQGKLL